MNKRLILFFAIAFVAILAMSAHAEVQNVKVGGDILLQGVARDNIFLRSDNRVATSNTFGAKIRAWLSTVRIKVDADLTDNVMTTVRLINEREVGNENNTNTDIDIDLAYVTLKEFLGKDSPMTLTLGRQEIRFGNGLVIGAPTTNGIGAGHGTATKPTFSDSLDDLSIRRGFDAARATLNYDPLIVDVIYAKINQNNVAAFDDIDLYGANANFAVSKTLSTDFYLFERKRETASVAAITSPETLRTTGVKATFMGIEDLMLSAEGAYQFGEHQANALLYPNEFVTATDTKLNTNRKVSAYALQAVANWIMPKKKFMPTLGGSYTYLSGDKFRSTKDNYNGWDPMFEDQAGGTLFNKILGYSNAQLFNVNGSMKPMDDVTVALNYWYIKLNQVFSNAAGAVNLSGVAGDPTYRMLGDKQDLAHEIDLGVTYDYTEDVQFGLNAGAFLPGKAFAKENDSNATQVIGSMKVTF
jgi:hypothetical protein